MALIIEDGTGVTGANAYISLAEFKAFADSRFVDLDDYENDQINGSIVVASVDFISVEYDIVGEPLTDTQGMVIPTDEVEVTSDIKNATYQAALLNLKGRLFVDTTELNINGTVTGESSAVGSLKKSTEYSEEGRKYTSKYPTDSIDRLMSKYLAGGGYAPAKALRY